MLTREQVLKIYGHSYGMEETSESSDCASRAIKNIMELKQEQKEEFNKRWRIFIELITSAFPHINLDNLFSLEEFLREQNRNQELLFVQLLLVSLDPQNAENHFALGLTYKELGKINQAIECLKKSYAITLEEMPKYNTPEDGILEDACSCLMSIAECHLENKENIEGLIAITEGITLLEKISNMDKRLANEFCKIKQSILDEIGW